MPIKKIEAGRVITQTIDTFIGQEGTIFYDEHTGELRLSDGVTPGGIPLLGGSGNGFAGSVGYTGSAGYDGSLGFTGSAGYDGSVGYSGSAGYDGSVGYTGSEGYWGSVGYTGSAGYDGSVGYTGSAGTSVKIVGSVPSSTDLPVDYLGDLGDGYLTADTGHLWVWTGSGWTDAGVIQGPGGMQGYAGSAGLAGYDGSRGIDGYAGSQGVDGYNGSVGYTGSQGPGADQDLNTTSSVTFANITIAAGGSFVFGNGSTQSERAPRMIFDQDFIDAPDYHTFFATLLPGDFYWSDYYSQIKILVQYLVLDNDGNPLDSYFDWQDLTVYSA